MQRCPVCGSDDVKLLLYGMLITPEEKKLLEEDKADVVGDVAFPESPLLMQPMPKYRCEKWHYFGVAEEATEKE